MMILATEKQGTISYPESQGVSSSGLGILQLLQIWFYRYLSPLGSAENFISVLDRVKE